MLFTFKRNKYYIFIKLNILKFNILCKETHKYLVLIFYVIIRNVQKLINLTVWNLTICITYYVRKYRSIWYCFLHDDNNKVYCRLCTESYVGFYVINSKR